MDASFFVDRTEPDISHYDEEQVKFMVEEFCITVNEKDEILGQDTKKACHLVSNIDKGLLHRAFRLVTFVDRHGCITCARIHLFLFSCFVFDKNKRLLLQQRASEKITFPDAWTNTCCSHPLYNILDERNGVQGTYQHAHNQTSANDLENNKQLCTRIK